MALFDLLHHHREHRARQLRWVLPLVAFLLVTVLATLAVHYRVSDEAVSTEFFRAHKTISHTGQLLERGLVIGGGVLTILVLAVAVWALRVTHRIVRPVHTVHQALDALAAGELGVRVELHQQDEFGEVGEALNRLVEKFAATLADVHGYVDRIVALSAAVAREAHDQSSAAELRRLVDELDRKLGFFRLSPRRTIRDGQS